MASALPTTMTAIEIVRPGGPEVLCPTAQAVPGPGDGRALIKAAIARSLKDRVWPLLEAGSVKPVIHATFPLAEAAAAHALMESGAHIGKIVPVVRDRVPAHKTAALRRPAKALYCRIQPNVERRPMGGVPFAGV